MSIASALGSTLKLLYGPTYSGGTWTPSTGTSTLVQATGGSQPSTIATPGGGGTNLLFDGSADNVSASANNASSKLTELNLAAVGTSQRMWFCIFKASANRASDHMLYHMNDDFVRIESDGKVHVIGHGGDTYPVTNAAVDDGIMHRLVVVGDDTTRVVTITLDGVAQTTTGVFSTAGFGAPAQWFASDRPIVGCASGGSQFFNGQIGYMGWAYTTGTFTSVMAALDTAFQALVYADTVQTTHDGPAIAITGNQMFDRESG